MLCNARVVCVMDYSAAIYGFKEYQSALNVHLKAIRMFLGVPKNACITGALSEVDLFLPHNRAKLQMICHYHRLLSMNNDRLNKKVLLWDKSLIETGVINTWFKDIKSIFSECNLQPIFEQGLRFNKQETISKMRSLLQNQRCLIEQECKEKIMLRTFLHFKECDVEPPYIGKPLYFQQRRILAKTRLGCLPLRIETDSYSRPRLREEESVCLVCAPNILVDIYENDSHQPVESEVHFMFKCAAYRVKRDHWYCKLEKPDNFDTLTVVEKLRISLN